MFITMRDGIREYMLRLEEIESFASKFVYNTNRYEIVMFLRNREEIDSSVQISEILVRDENGDLNYVKIEDLAHLAALIEKEKDYPARKEIK